VEAKARMFGEPVRDFRCFVGRVVVGDAVNVELSRRGAVDGRWAMGDGIMVFFNDPVPCPDPAECAVKMAMAMREAASALITAWRRRDRQLGFGVGIAQGYATLGQIGFAERSGYTAIGTVCNLAARLCAEAKDGQILISGRVAAAVEKADALEDLGSLTLKGLSQPASAFNVPLTASQPALRIVEGGPPSD
jgi:class 3 adenylate cyclase